MKNITMIVFKKELKDIFRDKKSLIMSIVIPLILFPIIFTVMGKSINKNTKDIEKNFKIAIADNRNTALSQFLKSQDNITIVDSSNISEDVKSGNILVGVSIPDDFEEKISKEQISNIELTYDNASQQSMMAHSIINSYIDDYSKTIVSKRLSTKNINPDILNPIAVKNITSVKETDGLGKFMLSLLLPLMLVIYSVTGPLAPATDLAAGEKERGTLEPLLTTQAGRMSLLWGKFGAITVMGLLTTISSLLGLYLGMNQKDGFLSGSAEAVISLDIKSILLIGLIAVLTTMVFGALELAISIYARSFKEAQTYLSPLTILAIIPTYATYMIDVKNISNIYFHIPLSNIVCLLKEFIMGIYNPTHIIITFSWILVYIVSSVLFARFMFSREDVIFRT
ncbi:MAG: ABC transporter permease [Clostridiaceae bacterium]